MQILLGDVCVSIAIEHAEGVLYSEGAGGRPLFDLGEDFLGPVELFGLAVAVAVHSGEEGFVVDDAGFGLIDEIEESFLLLLRVGYDLVDGGEPSFACDEATSDFVQFAEEVIVADFAFDGAFA